MILDENYEKRMEEELRAALPHSEEELRAALSRLEAEERELLEEYYFGHKGIAELAKKLGCSEKRVERKFQRARLKLRKLMSASSPSP